MDQLIYYQNYDFIEASGNNKNLTQLLKMAFPEMDYLVIIAIHDDGKTNLAEDTIQALKTLGALKIDQLEFRAPYLFAFHPKYGIIIEEVGKPGSVIMLDARGTSEILLDILE